MSLDIIKEYTNGELTIVWKPSMCSHSTICFRGLPQVFNPNMRPWVKTGGATTEQIINQVNQCPSGALSCFLNSEKKKPESEANEIKVETIPNGPLKVYGNLKVKDNEGNLHHRTNVTSFCRCGASSNKPFCDGSHKKIGFIG